MIDGCLNGVVVIKLGLCQLIRLPVLIVGFSGDIVSQLTSPTVKSARQLCRTLTFSSISSLVTRVCKFLLILIKLNGFIN